MSTAKTILGVVPAMQAASLLAETVPRRNRKRKLVKTGMKAIMGTSLIQANAQFIGGMD